MASNEGIRMRKVVDTIREALLTLDDDFEYEDVITGLLYITAHLAVRHHDGNKLEAGEFLRGAFSDERLSIMPIGRRPDA